MNPPLRRAQDSPSELATTAPRFHRPNVLQTLLRLLDRNRPEVAPQHAIIVGASWMGKTTTLAALRDEVEKSAALAGEWMPIMIGAAARFDGLRSFWLRCLRDCDHAAWAQEIKSPALTTSTGAEAAFAAFMTALDRKGRRALVLLEHLDRFMRELGSDFERRVLRAALIAESRLVLVGTTEVLVSEFTHYDATFFDFFQVIRLQPLGEEAQEAELGLPLERLPGGRDGIVRRLLAGNPGRLAAFAPFARSVPAGSRMGMHGAVQALVSACSHRFDALLGALGIKQVMVLEATALAWNPAPVRDIAGAVQLASNACSAQLAELVARGLVVSSKERRRYLYSIGDPLLSLFLLSRQRSPERDRLSEFLTTAELFADASTEASLTAAVSLDDGALLEDFERALRDQETKETKATPQRTVDERWEPVVTSSTGVIGQEIRIGQVFKAWCGYSRHTSTAHALEELSKLEVLGPLEFLVDAMKLSEAGPDGIPLALERRWLAEQLITAFWPESRRRVRDIDADRRLEKLLGPKALDLLGLSSLRKPDT